MFTSSFINEAAKVQQNTKVSAEFLPGQNKHPLLKVGVKTNSFAAQTQRSVEARKQRVTH